MSNFSESCFYLSIYLSIYLKNELSIPKTFPLYKYEFLLLKEFGQLISFVIFLLATFWPVIATSISNEENLFLPWILLYKWHRAKYSLIIAYATIYNYEDWNTAFLYSFCRYKLYKLIAVVEGVSKQMQPINRIIIYYEDKIKLHISWCKFMLDLDSVWVQLKILRCTWKTKFFGMSLKGLF